MMNADALRTLNHRLATQREEYRSCRSVAAKNCLEQAMADTRRQMRELLGAK